MQRTVIQINGRDLTICHDALPTDGQPLPTDIVVGPSGASHTLLRLVPRRHVNRVWDLGCGSGVQAVACTTHADTVIATDIDEKCLAYTQQSVRESGVQIETRLGSLADPVAGELFDLIVANPPFVIGGVTELVHRESPFVADGLVQHIVDVIPQHLSPDGVAIVLGAWLIEDLDNPFARLEPWLVDVDANVWVALRDIQTTSDYVETWLRDAGLQNDRELADRWQRQLGSWNANGVGFGWFVFEATADQPWVRLDDVRTAAEVPTGTDVLQRIADAHLSEHTLAPSLMSDAFARDNRQPWRGVPATQPVVAAIHAALDGQATLPEIVEKLAAEWQVEWADVLVWGLAGLKQLIDWGMAHKVQIEPA